MIFKNMKKILISLILIIVGIALGTFMTIKEQNNFYGYYSKTDKKITQNIEKSIELTSLNSYSKATYNVKNVKRIFLLYPYSWVDDELLKPHNKSDINMHWESSLADEDKYLLIVANDNFFLPIVLWRKYSNDDFNKLGTSLLKNRLCNKKLGVVSCVINQPIDIVISNIDKGKSNIMVKINDKESVGWANTFAHR